MQNVVNIHTLRAEAHVPCLPAKAHTYAKHTHSSNAQNTQSSISEKRRRRCNTWLYNHKHKQPRCCKQPVLATHSVAHVWVECLGGCSVATTHHQALTNNDDNDNRNSQQSMTQSSAGPSASAVAASKAATHNLLQAVLRHFSRHAAELSTRVKHTASTRTHDMHSRFTCSRGGRTQSPSGHSLLLCRGLQGRSGPPCVPCDRGSCGWWLTRTPLAHSCEQRCRGGRRGMRRTREQRGLCSRPPQIFLLLSCRRSRGQAWCTHQPTPVGRVHKMRHQKREKGHEGGG